tara:strand:+ start:98 stop:217 length:120 start_codon:yes stop_codon:yes gene_type:complete
MLEQTQMPIKVVAVAVATVIVVYQEQNLLVVMVDQAELS